MDWLARREHSRHELLQKLRNKFPEAPQAVLAGVIDRLGEQNLQSDQRFAEAWVRHRKSRGYGYLFIVQELRARGIPQPLIDRCLFEDDGDWLTIATTMVERRLPAGQTLSFGSKEHRRLLNFLQRRGFSPAQIRACLDSRLKA